uniref:Odorant receptor n=1 Tax=Bombyx mori TaxID=7091 RepID=Q4W1W6_BOMMO|nr:olfactory receptor-1 [Bombyx mori]
MLLSFKDDSRSPDIQKPQNFQYMKILRFNLKIICAWPEKQLNEIRSLGHSIHRVILPIQSVVCLACGILYIHFHFNEIPFFILASTFITVMMNLATCSRTALVMLFERYLVLTGRFITVMHLFNFQKNSDYAYKLCTFVNRMSHFYTLYVLFSMFMGLGLFNLLPLYNNYVSGAFSDPYGPNVTFFHSVYFAFPFDYSHNFRGYIIMALFNSYVSVTCSIGLVMFDLLMCLMVMHVWGHLKILSHNLINFPRPKASHVITTPNGPTNVETYTEEESKEVFARLRECIKHYGTVDDFANDMSETFGVILLVYYGFHQVSLCMLLLECSDLSTKAMLRYGPLTLIMIQQLIQISIIFELLGSVADRIPDAVYQLPWECMDVKNRRVVYGFLRRTQNPVRFKAMGMLDVGVQTMASILKTSISYFVMLRTVAT